ncbi:hypothetical protein HNP77_002219 [Treponema rectale]|uniref:DUF2442 domain-containing protein n=1 Tax=Treponema rectale TaxID=744512 RepID=A0A840SGH0_9SPIR|nr:DUF2442 domain-containing protein [Treponema rectale]MBB5219830.1 hypothetical protein [Treponema rectale]
MPNTVEYYISKGFDSKAASYFASGRRKPVNVVPQDSFRLIITFDNNEKRLLDMSSYIQKGNVYYILSDKSIFNRCYIDSDGSVCWDKDPNIDSEKDWSNKIDIGADNCYLESKALC